MAIAASDRDADERSRATAASRRRVNSGVHGLRNVTYAPKSDGADPDDAAAVEQRRVRRSCTSSNSAGNARLTRKMSKNSSTIEMHQITVTAAWNSQYAFCVSSPPTPRVEDRRRRRSTTSTVWVSTAVDRHLALVDPAERRGHPLLQPGHEQQAAERVVVDDRVRDEEPHHDERDDHRERVRVAEADLDRAQDVGRRRLALRRVERPACSRGGPQVGGHDDDASPRTGTS